MSHIFSRNNALSQNPPVADGNITVHGSDWYWAVFSVMAFSTVVFSVLSFRVPRANRVFHYITIAIVGTASIAYFSMASDLGGTPIAVEFVRSGKVGGATRQIFYVRYIDWVITTPLLLMDLLLTAALPWPTILFVVFADLVMVITGLIGALVSSQYKWGYFALGCGAFFLVIYQVLFTARAHARVIGSDVLRLYNIISVWTIVLWTLYPIAWGVCEGGNVIPTDSEAVFYGILDLLAKPVFGAILLWGHRNIDPARLGVAMSDPYATDEGIPSKRGHNGISAHDARHTPDISEPAATPHNNPAV